MGKVETQLRALLVTGSRDFRWSERDWIERRMRVYHAEGAKPLLIHGNQGKLGETGRPVMGLDLIAADVAEYTLCWKTLPMPAPWDNLGTQAGPARNTWMVNVLVLLRRCGYECNVLAFPLPGSRGTVDCIGKAERAGFAVTIARWV